MNPFLSKKQCPDMSEEQDENLTIEEIKQGSSTFVMGKKCFEGTGSEATWVDSRS
jgi:hypothetical protein